MTDEIVIPDLYTTMEKAPPHKFKDLYYITLSGITNPVVKGLLLESNELRDGIYHYGEMLELFAQAEQKKLPLADQFRQTQDNIRQFVNLHMQKASASFDEIETPEMARERQQDARFFAETFSKAVRQYSGQEKAHFSTPIATLLKAGPQGTSFLNNGTSII